MKRTVTHPSGRWPQRRIGTLAAAALLAGMALGAQAQDASQRLRARTLAATCAHCHGTDGRAVQGEALVSLAGRPASELLATLLDFRTGQRPATIMHQITRGYSQEQLESVANYFAAQK
ncbi:cytochrome C [Ideonella sp. A 288]|uniref:c-type cytochrome n=1 Tax=Ideonella sp. A 288 TaxID=1962181 RepID=UPI000B4A950B|nr:cytochrome C [Ideonella sp. A 288]